MVTALRGEEMTIDSVLLISFLLTLLGSLEGVLKAFGTAVASWMGLAVDFKEAVEKMAARDVAGVKTSVEAWATGRGVASDFFSGGNGGGDWIREGGGEAD